MKTELAKKIAFLIMIQEEGQIWEPDYSNIDTEQGSFYQWGLDAGFIHNYNEENDDGTLGERYGELTDLGHQLIALWEFAKPLMPVQPEELTKLPL
tara:strand:- start:477 stop:764 length:288 start_codon:yes stop_codon:yes gene_type:complete